MHILVAPDKFRGSLTARQAAASIAAGLRHALPSAIVTAVAIADGGEGTLDVLVDALGGVYHRRVVCGPYGRKVEARFGVCEDLAVVEMAEASGLRPASADGEVEVEVGCDSDATTATSAGTGELVLAALDQGVDTILLGVGGSGTTDAGAGMLGALGARFLDQHGVPVGPGGAGLRDLARIDTTGVDPRLAQVDLVIACDVNNPLIGETGAARTFSEQKGATPEQVKVLEAGLARFAQVLINQGRPDISAMTGAGAAGGLAGGAHGVVGARLEPGAQVVLGHLGLSKMMAQADLVITGEGCLDSQSLRGKAPVGVARAAQARAAQAQALAAQAQARAAQDQIAGGPPVWALVGQTKLAAPQARAAGFAEVHQLAEVEADPSRWLPDAAVLLERLAFSVALGLRSDRGRGGS